MIDLLRDSLPIFLSGYLGLTFFRFRQNKGFAKLNGEKFLIELFMWGFISHFSFLVAKLIFVNVLGFNFSLWSQLQKQLVIYLFYSLSGLFFGGVLSCKWIYPRILEENEKFKQTHIPDWSNRFEEEFVNAIYFEPTVFVFEISNGKFYVGYLHDADISDETLFEEKIFKIVPIMSGHRNGEQNVIYDTYYFPKEKFQALLTEQFSEELLKEYDFFLSSTPPVAIFLRELISYRKFDASLQRFFHPIKEDSKSLIG